MRTCLSLIKSSLHDIRCCDETKSNSLAWRAAVSSLTCVLNNGSNTGYVNVGLLEEYDTATNLPTGQTKLNVPSDLSYIPDYLDSSMCPIQQQQPQTALLYASNSCSGILVLQLTHKDTGDAYNFDIAPGTSTTENIPVGHYDILSHCSQQQPASPAPALNVMIIVNGETKVLATEAVHTFFNKASNLNISCKPTTQPIA